MGLLLLPLTVSKPIADSQPGFGFADDPRKAKALHGPGLHPPRLERRVRLGDRVGNLGEVAEEEVLHALRVGHAVVPHLGVHLEVLRLLKHSIGRQGSLNGARIKWFLGALADQIEPQSW